MASSHYHSHSPQIQVKQMPLTETGVIRIRRDLHLICSMCAKLQKLRDPLHMLVRREHFSGILTSFRTYMSLQLVAESKRQNTEGGRTEQKQQEGASWPATHSRARLLMHQVDTGWLNLIHPGSISVWLTLRGVNLTGSWGAQILC